MTPPLFRAVYDCDIYVQAIINIAGPAARCVENVITGNVNVVVSPFVLQEIREAHLKIPPKYGVTDDQTERLARAVEQVAIVLDDVPELFSYRRDPDDAHYVNLALAAGAPLVISRDRDLLDLMDTTRADGADFVARFPQLRILDPAEFLQHLHAARPRNE